MYFAFDHPSPNAVNLIADELAAAVLANPQRPLNIFAIIDGAFDERFFADRWRARIRRLSGNPPTKRARLEVEFST